MKYHKLNIKIEQIEKEPGPFCTYSDTQQREFRFLYEGELPGEVKVINETYTREMYNDIQIVRIDENNKKTVTHFLVNQKIEEEIKSILVFIAEQDYNKGFSAGKESGFLNGLIKGKEQGYRMGKKARKNICSFISKIFLGTVAYSIFFNITTCPHRKKKS